ncbi:MAG TPA: family 16 glycoside hydrolase, partial [Candidatus Solibacter sp.]|nr:family 16 glycoside hydrolase [Candidatus Solibacter sp.]
MRRTILLAIAITAVAAAQVPKNRAPLANEQWVKLFNGKDLTGWHPVGHEKWTVEEGAIHG